jgi:hypothetical protein
MLNKEEFYSGKAKLDPKIVKLYHAARVAFNTGSTTPWFMALHAIRQGLDIPGTYDLKPQDLEKYPDLKELITSLQEAAQA